MIQINQLNFSKIIKKLTNKTIKLGIDTNKNYIHIGHYSIIRILKYIKNNTNILILGNYTATIKILNKNNINNLFINTINLNEIKNILLNKLNLTILKILSNSNWLVYANNFNITNYKLNKLIKSNRFKNIKINLINNILYPFYQTLDSYFVNNKIEIGGLDQLNNFKINKRINNNIYFTTKIIKLNEIKISKSLTNKFNINKINNLILDLLKLNTRKLVNLIKYFYKIKFYKLKSTNPTTSTIKTIIILSIIIDMYGFKLTKFKLTNILINQLLETNNKDNQ